jgi:4a-hydroxytetrahydrobiopterin dehydratase
MSELASKTCVPCSGGVPPLQGEEITDLLASLGGGWSVLNERRLQKKYDFEDFARALEFTTEVGRIAEEEGHHPDIYLTWGMVNLSIWTHKIDGLTESDFILAAKADSAFARQTGNTKPE